MNGVFLVEGGLQEDAARLGASRVVLYVDCCPGRCTPLRGLPGVIVSRALTLDGLWELVMHRLKATARDSSASVLMVSGLDCLGRGVDGREYEALRAQVLDRLRALSRECGLLTMVSKGACACSHAMSA